MSVGGSHRAEYGPLDRGLLDPVKPHSCPKVDAFSHTSNVHTSINLLPKGHFHVTPPEKARFWTRRRPPCGLYAPNGPLLLRDIERQSGATCCAIFRLRGDGARKCANFRKFRAQFHDYCLLPAARSWIVQPSGRRCLLLCARNNGRSYIVSILNTLPSPTEGDERKRDKRGQPSQKGPPLSARRAWERPHARVQRTLPWPRTGLGRWYVRGMRASAASMRHCGHEHQATGRWLGLEQRPVEQAGVWRLAARRGARRPNWGGAACPARPALTIRRREHAGECGKRAQLWA